VDHAGGDTTGKLELMLEAAADRGARGQSTRLVDAPLNGAFGHAGGAATAQLAIDSCPFVHETGVSVTADIRLDNREALCSALGVDPGATSDAKLALLAYLRWQHHFVERLLGAFVIAIADPRRNQVLLCRDHMGVRPLVYRCTRRTLAFGSTAGTLLAHRHDRPAVYVDKLQHAMLDPLECAEPTTTVFNDVFRVPAASVLRWSPGLSPQISRYWDPQPEPLRLASDGDYIEQFREVFDQAVACRFEAPTRVAAMLSGGLDSSTVIAAATSKSAEQLRTYSFVEESPVKGSDAAHIWSMQRAFDVDAVSLSTSDVASAYDLRSLMGDPESVFDSEMGVLWAISQRSAHDGYGVLLTGIGGDDMLAGSGPELAMSLASAGRWRDAVREVARNDGRVDPYGLARFLARRLAPQPIRRLILDRRRRRDIFGAECLAVGIDPESAAGRRLGAAHASLGTNPNWNTGDHRVDGIVGPWMPVGFERYDRVAARHGVEIRHPFADKRVIDFCLSLPQDQLRRNGWAKWILRRAFETELPATVAWRPKEYVGMSPAADRIADIHGPRVSVPALAGVFGALGPLHRRTSYGQQWERFVVHTWWDIHGG